MITPDEEVRVIVLPLPREEWGWALTPDGEAALDASLSASTTQAIPRRVADEARELARQRKDQEITGDPPASL